MDTLAQLRKALAELGENGLVDIATDAARPHMRCTAERLLVDIATDATRLHMRRTVEWSLEEEEARLGLAAE